MSGWPVSFAIAVLAITLAAPAASHDVSRPAWFYCYNKCISALEKGAPPPPPDACAADPEPLLCRSVREALRDEGDGGKAYRRFRTCNTLCKGIQQ